MLRAHLALSFLISTASIPISGAQTQKSQDGPRLFAELRQLKTTDRATRQITASQDSDIRRYVAFRLPEITNRPEVDEVWLNAVRLTGRLKTSEAVPSLRTAFLRGPLGRPAATSLGWEMQLDDDIVAGALADIGEPSIPTVSEFLKDTNSKVRRRIR
jgi:hypothetical protein